MNIEQEFQGLIKVIENAGKNARAYFDAEDNENELKADGSVVTKIDQEIEAIIIDHVRTHFPEDSIVGE